MLPFSEGNLTTMLLSANTACNSAKETFYTTLQESLQESLQELINTQNESFSKWMIDQISTHQTNHNPVIG